jgi:hypothetical protein
MIEQLDAWLLDLFEQFSHSWQKTIGFDCFWLARACVLISFLSGLIFYCGEMYYAPSVKFSDSNSAALIFLEAVIGFALFQSISHGEVLTQSAHRKSTANPAKANQDVRLALVFIHSLMMFLLLLVLSSPVEIPLYYALIGAFTQIWFIMADYFSCCDPLHLIRLKCPSRFKSVFALVYSSSR